MVVNRRPGQEIRHFGALCSPKSPKSDESNSVFIGENTIGTPYGSRTTRVARGYAI